MSLEATIESDEYQLVTVEPNSDDWKEFHRVRRTALFQQSVSEYTPHYHDALYHRSAQRHQLLLKWKGVAVGVTTLDRFPDGTAATRAVAIADEFQGQGHGRALGILTQEFAKLQGTTSLCVNAGAHTVGFYASLGFERKMWDRNEYDEGTSPETVIQMVCHLP